jgi:polysaccharide export outer membrane protein
MSPTTYRCALAAVLLLCTATFAQNGAPSLSSVMPSPDNGVFKPAAPAAEQGQGRQGQSPQQPNPILSIGKEYRVGPNDLLDIEVLNLDNAKRTVRVNAAGYITLPLIGSVTVAGLTQQQAETHIAALYGDKYLQNPQVSVFIKEFTTERITVDGAVSKPGIYPLVGQMTLLRVIALAGGFGSIANSSQVMLFRQGEGGQRQVATFDVDRIRSGKDIDPPIRGDDLIVVQRDSTRALLKDSVFRDVLDSVNPFSVFGR